MRTYEKSRACAPSRGLTKNATSPILKRLSSTTSTVRIASAHIHLWSIHCYTPELSSDPTIRSHLAALYDTLLEQNLLRIIEPYSVVEISHVASLVGQSQQAVEAK